MAKEAKGSLSVDEKLIRKLAELLNETGLTEIEIEDDDRKVRVAKGGVAVAAPAPVAPAAAPLAGASAAAAAPAGDDYASHPGAVTSPMVGVCYLAPDPKSAQFCAEGDTVEAGDTLLLIEAMKVFNPISAPKGGKIVKILVSDGTPVEYGEPLVIIE